MTTTDRMLKSALAYAQRLHWYVIPVHTQDDTGACSCKAGTDCRTPGKHPHIKDWPNASTIDDKTITRWWRKWPNANVGIVCGKSGLLAVDLDVKNGAEGPENWADLCHQHKIDDAGACEQLTPSGGTHKVFAAPPTVTIQNMVATTDENGEFVAGSSIASGIDIRADGGLIVVAPSSTNAGTYAWEVSSHPLAQRPAPAPAALVALLDVATNEHRERFKLPETIAEGGRNDTLHRFACSLRARGMTADEILAAVHSVNETRCKPPLEAAEVEKLVASAVKHEPGHARQTERTAGGLPRLNAGEQNLPVITAETWAAIRVANAEKPFLFRFGGLPARLETDDNHRPVVRHLTMERMRYALTNVAHWYKNVKDGDNWKQIDAKPPVYLVQNLLATPDPPLPVLTSIVGAPVFGPDKTLQTQPGYHANSQTYYMPTAGFALPDVPPRPTAEDLNAAKTLILDDLLGDFPFTSTAESAHAVALLLLPFARQMIDGSTPLHLIEKPAPGTGASLLVNALHLVATGHAVTAMTEGRSDDEWRKRLTAKLLAGPQMLFVDNLRRRLDASALAAAITAPYWEDRILGKSEMIRVPIHCAWVCTGNNPTMSNEMARRTVRIRLDARMDRPWQRTEFRHKALCQWVRTNRARLVHACLTIVQHWVATGAWPYETRTLGTFEEWTATMGGILGAADIPGFLENLAEFYERADAESAAWRALVNVWQKTFTEKAVGVSELFAMVNENDVDIDLGTGTERSQRIRLGKALIRQRDKVYKLQVGEKETDTRTLRITLDGEKARAKQWKLEPVV